MKPTTFIHYFALICLYIPTGNSYLPVNITQEFTISQLRIMNKARAQIEVRVITIKLCNYDLTRWMGLLMSTEYEECTIHYDVVVTKMIIDWLSLTVKWFPDIESVVEKNSCIQRLILGTNTSGQETDYLMIANVVLPSREHFPRHQGRDGIGCIWRIGGSDPYSQKMVREK